MTFTNVMSHRKKEIIPTFRAILSSVNLQISSIKCVNMKQYDMYILFNRQAIPELSNQNCVVLTIDQLYVLSYSVWKVQFLLLRFYVKSIFEILLPLKLPIFAILADKNFVNLVNFNLQKVRKFIKIKIQSLLIC